MPALSRAFRAGIGMPAMSESFVLCRYRHNDNSQAERDIRMVKHQQKIFGSWRTLGGARNFCAIRSYASRLCKQDHNVLAGLRQLFDDQVWIPAGA